MNKLIEEFIEIVESKENEANKELWENASIPWLRDHWRGIPKGNLNKIPYTIEPDNSMWAYLLDIDLREYYSKPDEHLKNQLRYKIWHFNNFIDNTYFRNDVFIWFGVVTELALFGDQIRYFPKREAWIEDVLIKERNDLLSLKVPDFYSDGIMPLIHKYYERIKARLGNYNIEVMFPEWCRGPFCIAVHLRGMQNFLIDLIEDPVFVHDLMVFITESRKTWSSERAKFLNQAVISGKLYNDEISTPTISSAIYEEFVLPYEIELSKFHGGIQYWHSCGQTTDFFESIIKIPHLEMIHISPWASLERAVEVIPPAIALDLNLDPHVDVLDSNHRLMKERLNKIKNICKGNKYTIRADAFQVINGLETDLEKMKQWCSIAHQICSM